VAGGPRRVYSKGARPYAAFDLQGRPYLGRVARLPLGRMIVNLVPPSKGWAMGPEAANGQNRSKAQLAHVERLTGGAVAEAAD